MRNAKIIVARYKKGIMTKEQVLKFIESTMNKDWDKKAIAYIKSNL